MIHNEKEMTFNGDDKIKFDNAKVCHICEKPFGINKFKKNLTKYLIIVILQENISVLHIMMIR